MTTGSAHGSPNPRARSVGRKGACMAANRRRRRKLGVVAAGDVRHGWVAAASGLAGTRAPVFVREYGRWTARGGVGIPALDAAWKRIAAVAGDGENPDALALAWLEDYIGDLRRDAPDAVPSVSEALGSLSEWLETRESFPLAWERTARSTRLSIRRPTRHRLAADVASAFPGRSILAAPVRRLRYFGREPVGAWLLADADVPSGWLGLLEHHSCGGYEAGRVRLTPLGVRCLAADGVVRSSYEFERFDVGCDGLVGRLGELDFGKLAVPSLHDPTYRVPDLQPVGVVPYRGARDTDVVWSLRELRRIEAPRIAGALPCGREAIHAELLAWRQRAGEVLQRRIRDRSRWDGPLSHLMVQIAAGSKFVVGEHRHSGRREFALIVPRSALGAVHAAFGRKMPHGMRDSSRLVACAASAIDPTLVDAVWLTDGGAAPKLQSGQFRCGMDGALLGLAQVSRAPDRLARTWPLPSDTLEPLPEVGSVAGRVGYGTGVPRHGLMDNGREVRDLDERWAEMLRVASAYAETHGHLSPNKRERPENLNLYMWLINQERRLDAHKLEEARRAALAAIPAWGDRLRRRGKEPLLAVPGRVYTTRETELAAADAVDQALASEDAGLENRLLRR
ncbi:MAG: hypothetical protein C0497_04225 [Gemmatimonas sp.]|nr:hypothetical protein [Gemmatimonas sp.]